MRNLDFSTKVFRLLMLVLLLFSVQISRADEGWPRTLKGRIVDAKSGETLIGVNIQILGTTTGTISDFDGGFQLVVKANSVIQFSYVGYKPIEIKAEEAVKKTVFQMEEDAGVLEEVVVVGYGTQKKVTSVGSITQADGNKLLRGGSVNSVTEALQGKLNGVVAINSGGMPGGNDVSMYIRGKSTWGNTDPLVLLDGIQSDIKDVDMNEIESISVLKDASATAVYGVRGGNGVILITTKRGTNKAPTISFSANYTYKSPTTSMELADYVTSIRAYNQAMANDGSWNKL
ncbi:carboxypeptidase-like regulatory domain-containing protein, partial [Bacteroides ovatus]